MRETPAVLTDKMKSGDRMRAISAREAKIEKQVFAYEWATYVLTKVFNISKPELDAEIGARIEQKYPTTGTEQPVQPSI